MSSLPGWLSALFGPVRIKVSGVLFGSAPRSTVNFVNLTVEDDAVNDQTTITAGGSGSVDLTPDVTGVLPTANGGTGASNLTFPSGPATVVARTTTETLQNKSMSFGSNTFTMTSAQLATACSDETGSGALVFASAPALANPTISGVTTVAGLVNTGVQTSSSTGTINDFALTAGVNYVRLTGAAPVITGITGGTQGRRVVFHATAGNAVFNGEDAGSTAANRITTALSTVTCYRYCVMEFFYDGTSQRWVVFSGIAAPET